MPFGLKNAPSQFQKAMVMLFQPLLANALIYVDDILLFSKDEESHAKLLTEFYNLVKSQAFGHALEGPEGLLFVILA